MTGWAVETFVATTALMLLVLVIRAPVRKAFGPGIAYALWLLPVLRMALPPLPESWREQASAPVAAMSQVITFYVVDAGAYSPALPAGPDPSPIDCLLIVAAVWGAGALAFLGFHLVSHSRFCRRLLSAARIDRTVANGRVRVIETDAAHGPLAFGIWRKYVAFPRDFSERYDEQERDLALAHELGHHVRGDLIANWVALVVLALHWFNPVAWKAFRAFRADQEMACDALVLAGRETALRHAYGRAIVKSAHGGAVSAACHLHTINELKGRLRMLTKTRKLSRARFAAGLVGVSALSLAALGLTASGSQAAEKFKSKVEAVTGVSLSLQNAPPPPAEPDAVQDAPKAPVIVERRVYRDGPDDKDAKHQRHVVIIREGPHGEHMADMPDMPDVPSAAEIQAMIPDIQSGNCRKVSGDGKNEMVIEHPAANGQKRRMVICVDRIQHMAENSRHMGMQNALMGLHMARRTIESEEHMTAAEREEALKGIDDAIRQVEKQTAEKDDDSK
jgi:bla regulator protein BlaR1